MNKRVAFWAGLTVIGYIVVTKTQLVNTLLGLVILGIVPGTDLVLPAWVIMTLYPLVFIVMLFWLTAQQLFIGEPVKQKVTVTPVRKQKKTTATKARTKPAVKRRSRVAV